MSSYSTTGVPCTWMRGGTSKGAYFLAKDLPSDESARDALLLSVMGSPDERQIDGIGGADPLCSKVAIVSRSQRPDADIDYLFLQVFVDRAVVSDAQNCGNILSGVGQFAIEQELVKAAPGTTQVAVYMQNSDQIAELTLNTPDAQVTYAGDTAIDGVPGTSAPVLQNFPDAAGSSCGSLLPTGSIVDTFDGIQVTCIDNGMPVVVLRAADVGITGYEDRATLDNNETLKGRLESIRLQVGDAMNLGDITDKSVPKMTMVSAPQHGGAISTRTFIPHRCHASIGVLGAVSVATACKLKGSPAAELAVLPDTVAGDVLVQVEHPIGQTGVLMNTDATGVDIKVNKAAIVRTARKLFAGKVFPSSG